MRIAVTAVAAKKSGGSTLILEKLIEHLPRVAGEHHFRFFVSEPFFQSLLERNKVDRGSWRIGQPFAVGDNIELVAVRLGTDFDRLLWDQLRFPPLLQSYGADIAINALGFGPLFPGVNQCTFLQDSTYFCEERRFQRSPKEQLRIEAMRILLKGIMNRSKRIVVPSQSLADAICKYDKKLRHKVVVVRDPFEAEYQDPATRHLIEDTEASQKQLRVLYLSHLEPHKNHILLPQVATGLLRRTKKSFKFVLAVDRNDSPRLYDAFIEEMKRTGTESLFDIHSRLSSEEVTRQLALADVFFFPSVCESFGYPMVEAGAAGLPIVAADTPINHEMLGDNALYFPPHRADKAAEVLAGLFEDPALRCRCAAAIQRHQKSLLIGWEEYCRRAVKIAIECVDE